MYKEFYGLTRNPFELTQEPGFFYPTSAHNEALGNLIYGVQWRKGLVVVTGQVGTGKTLLVHCLMDILQRSGTAFSYVINTRFSVQSFFDYVLSDLHLPITGRSKGELVFQLRDYLAHRHQHGLTTVLLVDEAQLLSWDLLEEIRLLTNLEIAGRKLLQIVLAGQPELDTQLDSMDVRQLKQRIALRCTLRPLTEAETRGYILHRLERAGANSHSAAVFSDSALAAVFEYSSGIPRLINTVCENALLVGYAKQQRRIAEEVVEEVSTDFRLSARPVGTTEKQQGPSSSASVEAAS
jgi:general secretion pathway protein A